MMEIYNLKAGRHFHRMVQDTTWDICNEEEGYKAVKLEALFDLRKLGWFTTLPLKMRKDFYMEPTLECYSPMTYSVHQHIKLQPQAWSASTYKAIRECTTSSSVCFRYSSLHIRVLSRWHCSLKQIRSKHWRSNGYKSRDLCRLAAVFHKQKTIGESLLRFQDDNTVWL